MELRLLGAVEVESDAGVLVLGGPKERALLALLALQAGPLSAEHLVDELWGDDPPVSARKTLQTYVWRLRGVLPAGALVSGAGGYLLDVESEPDAVRFERFVEQGGEALQRGDVDLARDRFDEALSLWRGEPFTGCAPAGTLRARQARLDELRSRAVEGRVEAELRQGHHTEVVAELEDHVRSTPLRERLWEMLALALYRCGRQADALRACQRARRLLADELGIDPGPDLVALEGAILQQDASLDWTPEQRQGADGRRRDGERPPRETRSRLPGGGELVPFAGRTLELDALRQWWSESDAGARFAVVVGEAGIGKSRLVSTFAREVEAGGTRVHYGRGLQASGSSYEPMLGVLRQFVATASDDALDQLSETAAASLARLVPELTERRRDAGAVASSWGELDRSWLLGAVADAFAPPGGDPTLLMLDDFQWADRPAVLLLANLLEPDREVRVVGTYRHPGGSPTTELAALVAELRRHDRPVRRMSLGGLSHDDVVELLTAYTGADLPRAGVGFASDLHERTGGHPLFVGETLRHLRDTGVITPSVTSWDRVGPGDLGVAEGVGDVVRQRLCETSEATRTALQAAAVIGVTFDGDVVAAATDRTDDEMVTAVEEALAAGLVAEAADEVDRYHFVHALVHEVLLGELSRSRRARLEWRIGEILVATGRADLDERAAEVADHYLRGVAVGDPMKAVDWARRAGAHALQELAYEDAVRYFDAALGALEMLRTPPDRQRADLLLSLGRAANLAGDSPRWRSSCLAAAELARRLGDPDRLAQAAISLLGTLSWGDDETVLAVMTSAAELLRAAAPSPQRQALLAELLARLAAYMATTEADSPARLVEEALSIARAAGDRRALAIALVYSTHILPLPRGEHRERLLEAARAADAEGDLEMGLAANTGLMIAALQWADRDEYDAHLAEYARVASLTRAATPLALSTIDHAGAAAIDGRYDDADRLMGDALRRAASLGDPALASNIRAGQYPVARERGQVDARFVQVMRRAAKSVSAISFQAHLVRVLADAGEHDEASELLHALLADPERLQQGFLRRYQLAAVAEAAATLGDVDAAEQIYRPLSGEERHGECVVVGAHQFHGALRRYVGLVAHTIGAYQEAVDHHEAALAVHERMRAPGWAARSRYDLARALSARGEPGDAARAALLLAEASETARQLGMPRLLEELERLAPPP